METVSSWLVGVGMGGAWGERWMGGAWNSSTSCGFWMPSPQLESVVVDSQPIDCHCQSWNWHRIGRQRLVNLNWSRCLLVDCCVVVEVDVVDVDVVVVVVVVL